jgi:hypothetical protein
MASEGEIDRALASITSTLNDQKAEGLDPSRVQHIVNDSLGGPQESHGVMVNPAGLQNAYIFDGSRRVAEIKLAEGRWEVEKTG